MKRRAIFHNANDIKNALLLFGQGWTTNRIARKMKVSDATVYNWKKRYPKYAIRKVITDLTKNGATTTVTKPVTARSTSFHEVTITLDGTTHKNLVNLATVEVRTVSDQVKYLVHRALEQVHRNSINIPL